MERRYEDELNFRFDQVHDVGFATITKAELFRWWDRKRETASIWGDLNDRWLERGFRGQNNRRVPLLISEWQGTYTLAWGEAGWLDPLTKWADGTSVAASKLELA